MVAVQVVDKLGASPASLPLPRKSPTVAKSPKVLGEHLGALGYPGFEYLRHKAKPSNPAVLLFRALDCTDLDPRVLEGLPWVVVKFSEMDWDWLVRESKVHNRQNRLGYVVDVAADLVAKHQDHEKLHLLQSQQARLNQARLAVEGTLCRDSMTNAERNWLRDNRPDSAKHWNLLTDLKAEHLGYEAA
jgi:hypothetical protein